MLYLADCEHDDVERWLAKIVVVAVLHVRTKGRVAVSSLLWTPLVGKQCKNTILGSMNNGSYPLTLKSKGHSPPLSFQPTLHIPIPILPSHCFHCSTSIEQLDLQAHHAQLQA